MTAELEVQDDPALLDLMMADYHKHTGPFSATARWKGYSDDLLTFLREEGLRGFRGRAHAKGTAGAVLGSFGALDINHPSASAEDLYHNAAMLQLGAGAKHISQLECSRIGGPQGYEIGGKFYTLSWLNFYCRYAYVSKFLNLDDKVIVEVGPGSGKQAEMIRKAHPSATLVLFDLPTQLYVANRYLTAVFGDDVVPYETARDFNSAQDIERGKINILPSWKFPIVEDVEFDLLWNAASFQEMGVETSKAYLDAANRARFMYLMYNIKYRPSSGVVGERGVIGPRYFNSHTELDRTPAHLAHRPQVWLYHDSFWAGNRMSVSNRAT